MNKKHLLKLRLILFFIFFISSSAYGESIKIGQSLPLTGIKSEAAIAFKNGCDAWIKDLNKRGGINGQQIELITLDDKGDAELAVKNTEKLISGNVFTLFGYMGYDSCVRSAEIAEKSDIPFFAAATGSGELHNFTRKNIFTLRPGYYTEVKNILNMLIAKDNKKVAILYSNSNWGKNFYKSAQWIFDEKKIKIFNKVIADAKNPDIKKISDELIQGKPDAVIVGTDSDIAIEMVKSVRKTQPHLKIILISDSYGDKVSKTLVNKGVGVVVSQVVPFPYYRRIPIVGLFNRLTEKHFPLQEISFHGLEGFISAKALTTIISECGENPSRKKFTDTAENLRPMNLGGFIFDFSKESHTGSVNTYLTQIGPGGFLTPIRSLDDIYKYSNL